MPKLAVVALGVAIASCSPDRHHAASVGRDAARAEPSSTAPAAYSLPEVVDAAQKDVVSFFGAPYPAPFDVRTFPDRPSLDAFVAQRWKMPRTECWMVAMGSGSVLVLLDPGVWKAQACEHDGADARHIRQIITHELVHVFHGQHCPQPEFDGMDDMGWFVEGLAIFASGQLDAERLAQARAAAASGLPHHLSEAWSGNARYALAGSLVAYVDRMYGRATINRLMAATTNDQLLGTLGTTEERLLTDWRAWVATATAP
jgi:hypothetical protein